MLKFATAAPVTTVLDIPAGLVRFIAADRADTTVEVLPANPAKNRDTKAAEQTTVEYADGVLRIAGPVKNQILGASGAVEVTVQLPAGSHVQAKAAAAELRGVGRLGGVTFEGAQASVKLDEAASLYATVAAGDVEVGRLTGPAEIATEKGDIRVTEAVRGTVTLRTQAGDLTIATATGTSATLDAGTAYGRIHNSLKNTGSTPDLTIHATTAYGDITARSL
ncbi:hypothetical protein AF335_01995 [Streptomyces eurocidicus]|uniref:DUF4097 and DUF4098 domain-containing protein YvlB n=1 Tax=Streptomyces eurocidicus TaxID=66423 RepID=A0A2N8P2C8_STREU|nr:DUF4097 family beta strand repeat-containing protein [Streptomyces eurocidicus]MBB5121177.1 DUF4097 and DUF4098 domain-containing protein YvlB [Streptomyces eurocidicus]MBF6054189.1 DUF4097 family beta strand repeat protein [Streptomyces eurocidicus]PNE35174.1 hypothetical protein AF335_01995 [Streptomyces eurocidicus]